MNGSDGEGELEERAILETVIKKRRKRRTNTTTPIVTGIHDIFILGLDTEFGDMAVL